jgi:iron complex outermembrane recepter protein
MQPADAQKQGTEIMKISIRKTALRGATCLTALATFGATTAYAQEDVTSAPAASAPVEEEVIVVTGSRIARPDLEGSSPVAVVTAEDLVISGTNSPEEFLRTLPQAVPALGGNTNNGSVGAATVDLRNLSEERTLVLVDGKRFVPFDSNGIVDLNMIPSALIERVEVLTGGASSVYGSDAIAGVVNFVLKQNFEGLEIDGQLGITERGDGFDRSFSVTMGVNSADGRGNIVANVGYVKTDAVNMGQRRYSRNVLDPQTLEPGGNSDTNAFGTVSGLVSDSCDADGDCVFNDAGNLVANNNAQFGFNFNPYNLLQIPQEKWTATALGSYEITDAIEFYGRASFANTRVTAKIAPSGTFFFPFDIDYLNNPNLTAQARGVLAENDVAPFDEDNTSLGGSNTGPGDGIVSVGLGRRTVELGTRDSVFENTAYQFVGGLRGDIVDGLTWEAFAQWGRTSRTQTFANDISFSRTQAGITDGSVNLFGPGRLTQEAGQQIRLDLQQYDTTSQTVAGGFLSYELPWALGGTRTGGIVGGVEYRREATTANPDENLIQGNAPGFGSSTPINAEIKVKEIYAEAKIPIFDIVTLEGGIRYADYQNRDNLTGRGNSFKNTSWKVGGDIEPVDGIRLRAMYQRAVRAPNLNEIGQPITPSTGDLSTDPCASANLPAAAYIAGTPLAQLCVATGVPIGRGITGNVGDVPDSGQINNYIGGNIDLTPEKSETITAGVVLSPTMLPGFSASVDYFDIKVENAIIQLPEAEVVAACYQIEQDPTGEFCQRVVRNPLNGTLIGGTETGVNVTNINAGFLRSEGVDIAANYRFDTGEDSRLTLGINATYTIKGQFQSAEFSPVRECVGLVGKTCTRGVPEWVFVQTTTFETGPATVQLRWRYIGELSQDAIAFGDAPASAYAVPTIGARSYFDLFSSLDVTDNFTFRFGINNLLNKKPPIVGNDYGGTAENSGNTFPATYEPLGRNFFVGAKATF